LVRVYPLFHVYHARAIFDSIRDVGRLQGYIADSGNESKLKEVNMLLRVLVVMVVLLWLEREYLADVDVIDPKLGIRMCLLSLEDLLDGDRSQCVAARTLEESKQRGTLGRDKRRERKRERVCQTRYL
jgi:hypothetical protein